MPLPQASNCPQATVSGRIEVEFDKSADPQVERGKRRILAFSLGPPGHLILGKRVSRGGAQGTS